MKNSLIFIVFLSAINLNLATLSHEFDMSKFGPNEGIKIKGDHESVSSAGDVNGDGSIDLIVAAPKASSSSGTESGIVYLIYGKSSASEINLASLDNSQGIKIIGAGANHNLGTIVSSAGDFNGDQIDDVIIASSVNIGNVYIIFGKKTGFSDINLSNLDNSQGIKIYDSLSTMGSSSLFGLGVNRACDFNGDGIGDLIIAQPYKTASRGITYVIFGKNGLLSDIDVSAMDNSLGVKIFTRPDNSIRDRNRVGCAGDFNGDGVTDVIVGTQNYTIEYGFPVAGAYIIFGDKNQVSDIDTDSLGTRGIWIRSPFAFTRFSSGVSKAGDVNQDGLDDVIILSPGVAIGYIIFGKKDTVSDYSLLQLKSYQGINFAINGGGTNEFGDSTASIGDFNGDGIDDIIVGSNSTLTGLGKVFILYGKKDGLVGFNLTSFDNSQGIRLYGATFGDQFGKTVSNAGDMNGDGANDIIISAPGIPGDQISYIVFGMLKSGLSDKALAGELTEEDKKFIQSIADYLKSAGIIIPVINILLQIIDPGSPSLYSTILLINRLQYIRYLDINYPVRLILTFKKQVHEAVNLNFGPLFPEKLEQEVLSHQALKRFADYGINGLLLVNLWRALTTFVILVIVLCLVSAIGKIKLKHKTLVMGYEKAKEFILWNYMLSFLLTNSENVFFFSIVEYKTLSLDGAFAIISFIISIICLLLMTNFLVYIPRYLYWLSKSCKYKSKEEKIKAHVSTKVLHEQFKEKYFFQELFPFIVVFRATLSAILVAAIEAPIVQCSLLIAIGVSMMLYLAMFKPQINFLVNIELMGYEIIILIVNITCLYLATLDRDQQYQARGAANIILGCNITMISFPMLMSVLKIIFKLIPLIKKKLNSKNEKAKVNDEISSPTNNRLKDEAAEPVDNARDINQEVDGKSSESVFSSDRTVPEEHFGKTEKEDYFITINRSIDLRKTQVMSSFVKKKTKSFSS